MAHASSTTIADTPAPSRGRTVVISLAAIVGVSVVALCAFSIQPAAPPAAASSEKVSAPLAPARVRARRPLGAGSDAEPCPLECDQACLDALGATLVPPLLDAFNAVWPAAASAAGIDPFTNVWKGDIAFPASWADPICDATCAVQLAACSRSLYLTVDVDQIDGIGDVQLDYPTAQTIGADRPTAPDGCSCPVEYDTKVYASMAPGKELKVRMEDMAIKFQCKWSIDIPGLPDTRQTYTYVQIGDITCTSRDLTASATLKTSAAQCPSVFELVQPTFVEELQIDKSDTSFSCDAPDLAKYVTEYAVDFIVEQLEATVIDLVEPVVEDAINREIMALVDTGL